MPNPKPTYFSTGNYETRDQLRAAIHRRRTFENMDWRKIGRETGVSDRTAKRCYEEEVALRKEARRVAYGQANRSGISGSKSTGPALTMAASKPTSGLKGAAFIYALLLVLAAIAGVSYAYAQTHGLIH